MPRDDNCTIIGRVANFLRYPTQRANAVKGFAQTLTYGAIFVNITAAVVPFCMRALARAPGSFHSWAQLRFQRWQRRG